MRIYALINGLPQDGGNPKGIRPFHVFKCQIPHPRVSLKSLNSASFPLNFQPENCFWCLNYPGNAFGSLNPVGCLPPPPSWGKPLITALGEGTDPPFAYINLGFDWAKFSGPLYKYVLSISLNIFLVVPTFLISWIHPWSSVNPI